MKNNYFLYFCNFLMMIGVLLGLNSMSWLMMWISMEITLMFFIPCLILNKSILESFSCLKYFIFQCLGSIFFILGSMDFFYLNTFGLFMKLGLFPNHFWMFMVSKSLSWKNFFFIMTLQKILPLLFLIISFNFLLLIFIMLIFLNSFLGNMGSLNQMDLRCLMIFSSMNHMSWMILSNLFNMFYFLFYFTFYSILNMYMYMIFKMNNSFYLYQIFVKKNYNFNIYMMLMFLIFFSFLGFPPLVGFFMKLISMYSIMMVFLFLILFFMLMQNLIISYSYIRVMIFFYMNLSRSIKMTKFFLSMFMMYLFFFFMFLI